MCECISQRGVKNHSSDCKEMYPNPPHIHAELIIAWANGAEIEVYWLVQDEWRECLSPSWGEDSLYRIKPKKEVIKFRLYLSTSFGKPCVRALDWNTYTKEKNPDKYSDIFWLSVWQEKTIEGKS